MGGGPGGSGNNGNNQKDQSPSIKLVSNGNKKGRKRQLTDGGNTSNTRDSSLTCDTATTMSTHVAMLAPSAALAASDLGQCFNEESSKILGLGCMLLVP